MSGRVRKQTDCPAGKQGPMRATLPVSSVLKGGAGAGAGVLKRTAGNSPASPPTVWRRVSPDHVLSGQRSPGAVNYKGKGQLGTSVIRRTASLDTLCHTGQWPRDYYFHAGQLQVDKSTQTEEGGAVSARSSEEERLERFLRARMQRARVSPHDHHHAWSWLGAHSSVEGLNQEIECLVLHPAVIQHTHHEDKSTPEGHRAPLAELLRRSVNTQTPRDVAPPSSGGSVCSSPEETRLGASPQINRFLAREPPDGCEKVSLRASEGVSGCVGAAGVVTAAPFTLRPSQGSAFLPLHAHQPSNT